MPTTPHIESHFTASETVRDIVIGMADGLTVPFALAAGLSAAVETTEIVVTAGLAEIAAGAIAMGLGGYLAGRTDVEHYASEERREYAEVEAVPHRELQEVRDILSEHGLEGATLENAVEAIAADKKRWVDFMMRFELGLEKPQPGRALASGGTIGAAYVAGGLVPLVPYVMMPTIAEALPISVAATALALAVFGAVKGRFTGVDMTRAGVQTLLVGGVAAAAAYGLAAWLGG